LRHPPIYHQALFRLDDSNFMTQTGTASVETPTAPSRRGPVWLHSIRFQVALALGLLFLMLAASVGFTLYELSLRRHDYQILNLAGQLRVTITNMRQQARNYVRDTPADFAAYNRDLGMFYEDLRRQMALYDQIIDSFKARRLAPALTGRDEPLTCKWDALSRHQLDLTADDWRIFRAGLLDKIGDDPAAPRLNWAAEYLVQHGGYLSASTDKLALGIQVMMEGKLARIQLINKVILGMAALIMLALLAYLYRNMVDPLRQTIAGFERVALGDLGYQVPVTYNNEIGQMTAAFNQLSGRLNALFQLTDRINLGSNLNDTLRFVQEEFRSFLPVEWVGLLLPAADSRRIVLERQQGHEDAVLDEGSNFSLDDPDLNRALIDGKVVHLDRLADHVERSPASRFATSLLRAGFASALLMPTSGSGEARALLVFASRQTRAYTPQHTELLGNVAGQLTHALDKTVFMEKLVVAAVQGLAKLAESRDPETGDHLVRMALYSAIVAEEMGREGPHRTLIDAAYVRHIHQFAPMHDIGKVGIADSILLKPGRLDDDERSEIQRHPVIGGEVLRRCESQVNGLGYSIFQVAVEIAEAHHERYDGTGYPNALAGQDIPLSARIVAVADVFDALTSKRPYKEAWSVEKALSVMETDSGRHFDPDVMAALQRGMPKVLEIYERLKHV
jgi:HD-GYP domain-containing protein (c-di-GMP phosphodiesterase class II)/HAMP domain-containing protein